MKKPLIGLLTFFAVTAAGAAVAYAVNKRNKKIEAQQDGDYIVDDLENILVDEVDPVEQTPVNTSIETVDADSPEILEVSNDSIETKEEILLDDQSSDLNDDAE